MGSKVSRKALASAVRSLGRPLQNPWKALKVLERFLKGSWNALGRLWEGLAIIGSKVS
jgi:hypothetical protein